MAWLKVAGWQLPRLRGKQVFLAPCLGGSGTGLINHGEQHQVLVFFLIPTPTPLLFSLPSCRAGNCPEPQQPRMALTQPPCTLPHCCLLLLLLLLLASSHTARSGFLWFFWSIPAPHLSPRTLLPAPSIPISPQSFASQTYQIAEPRDFPNLLCFFLQGSGPSPAALCVDHSLYCLNTE